MPAANDPPVWFIAPAEIRFTTFVALTLPASVMSPVLVVSASVLAPPVSVTGPATSNGLLFTSAKPALVLNAPSVSIWLVGWVRLAKVPALPVRLATVNGPPVWVIGPVESSRRVAAMALFRSARRQC